MRIERRVVVPSCLVFAVVVGLAAAGCDADDPPPANLIYGQLGAGMIYGSWSPESSSRVIFVGGGESSSCDRGVRSIVEFDGYGWKFLQAYAGGAPPPAETPMPVDGGTCPCPEADAGSTCSGPTVHAGTLRAIYGFSPQEFFAAGQDGTILRVTTTGVEEMKLDTDEKPYFKGLWGSSATDIWAVGGITSAANSFPVASIYHYDGVSWKRMAVPTGAGDLFGIWGARSDRVWAVGLGGTLVYFDGSSWQLQPAGSPPTSENLTAISGRDESEVYVVGNLSRFILLHYNGSVWRELKTNLPPATQPLAVRYFDKDVVSSGTHVQSFPDELVITAVSGMVARGSVDGLKADSRFETMLSPMGVGLHTIVPFYTNSYMLAGGNVFNQSRSTTFATIMSVGVSVTDSMGARNFTGSGDFPAGTPPPTVGGGGMGPGW